MGKTPQGFLPHPHPHVLFCPTMYDMWFLQWHETCRVYLGIHLRVTPKVALVDAPVMARLAQGPVVGVVPEQRLVALVWHDVVDHGRRHDASGPLALGAKRMLREKCQAIPLPPRRVSALMCAAAALSIPSRAHALMRIAPRSAPRDELSASRRGAWVRRCHRHGADYHPARGLVMGRSICTTRRRARVGVRVLRGGGLHPRDRIQLSQARKNARRRASYSSSSSPDSSHALPAAMTRSSGDILSAIGALRSSPRCRLFRCRAHSPPRNAGRSQSAISQYDSTTPPPQAHRGPRPPRAGSLCRRRAPR